MIILDWILLIDDDDDSNFIHKRLIQKMGVAEKVEIATNGLEALAFLKSRQGTTFEVPSIIFLDLNMPKMDGWEFLEEYGKLEERQKSRTLFIKLTTSLNHHDQRKIEEDPNVTGYINKFLDKDSLEELLKKHFS